MTPNIDIFQTLVDAALNPKISGKWLRIAATWRGSADRNIAVHSVTGEWWDHAQGGGKHTFRELCKLLKATPSSAIDGGTPKQRQSKDTKKADQWLREGFGLQPLSDLSLEYDLHGLSTRERMAARERRSRECKEQAALLDMVRGHFAHRLPGLDFDPIASLPTGSKVISHWQGVQSARLALPVFGFEDGGTLGIDAAHITTLMRAEDGSITKGTPKSFIPSAEKRHPHTRHVPLIRKDGQPERTLTVLGHQGPLLVAGEGLEDTLSVMAGAGTNGLFALNKSGLQNLLSPALARNLLRSNTGFLVCGNRDKAGPEGQKGQDAAAELVRACRSHGIPAWLLLPPLSFGEKADWNDVHRRAGIAGLQAAMVVALENAEAELARHSQSPKGVLLSLNGFRSAEVDPAPTNRVPLEQAATSTKLFIRNFLQGKAGIQQPPCLLASDPGNGKSHILNTMARDMQMAPQAAALGVLTPTKKLADEAADKSGGLRQHGRSPEDFDPGHCPNYQETIPFAEQNRSQHLHNCQTCIHGEKAMALLKGEEIDSNIVACGYTRHVMQVRSEPVATAPMAVFQGDPKFGLMRVGKGEWEKRKLVFDDTSALEEHRLLRTDQINVWTRTTRWMAKQQYEGDEKILPLLQRLIPELQRLSQAIAAHDSHEQIRLDPANWTDLCQIVASSNLKCQDATISEAVHKEGGEREIPLRALRDLGRAIARGTAWLRKGFLHFSVPTRLTDTLIRQDRQVLLMDATPSLAVREIVDITGGQIEELRIQQPTLTTKQIFDGGHGKTVCTEKGSQEREIRNFELWYQQAINLYGEKNVCALTHKDFAEIIRSRHFGPDGKVLPGWDAVGWWGNHNRGQNHWKEKTYLLVWGVQQLSPAVAEREYMAQRQTIIETCAAAGKPVPAHWQKPWNGERAARWARIPGQKLDRQYQGYADDWIDQWARSWTTAELVQGIGRLRATRRNVPLIVEIHSNFVPTEEFGIEIHQVDRGGRTIQEYGTNRHDSQQERGKLAILSLALAGKDSSYRKTADALKSLGLKTVRPDAWCAMVKTVTAQVYSLFQSGNTPARLHPDESIADAVRELTEISDFTLDIALETAAGWLNADYTVPAEKIAAKLVLELHQLGASPPQDRPACS